MRTACMQCATYSFSPDLHFSCSPPFASVNVIESVLALYSRLTITPAPVETTHFVGCSFGVLAPEIYGSGRNCFVRFCTGVESN